MELVEMTKEQLVAMSELIVNEHLLVGNVFIDRVNHGGIESIAVNGNGVKVVKVLGHGDVVDFEELRKINDLYLLIMIEEFPNPNRIEFICPPDIACNEHIYREEREFKKQKKEKFKSPMWNF